MKYSKKRDIMDKCERKSSKYDAIVNCAYIDSRSSDILYHVNCLAKLLCVEVGSAKEYDAIMSDISREVAQMLRLYAKED